MPESYEADYFCKTCHQITEHTVHSEGHERDSFGDYKQCKTCETKVYFHGE